MRGMRLFGLLVSIAIFICHGLAQTTRQIGVPAVSPLPPAPSASPSALAQPITPVTPPAGAISPAPAVGETAPLPEGEDGDVVVSLAPGLEECRGGISRAQVLLLIELCFEMLLVGLACMGDAGWRKSDAESDASVRSVRISRMAYLQVRTVYTVVVVVLNLTIYWIGGGASAACLASYGEQAVAFTNLVLYALFCVVLVAIGMFRARSEREDTNAVALTEDDTLYDTEIPPERTASFHAFSRPARRDSAAVQQRKSPFCTIM